MDASEEEPRCRTAASFFRRTTEGCVGNVPPGDPARAVIPVRAPGHRGREGYRGGMFGRVRRGGAGDGIGSIDRGTVFVTGGALGRGGEGVVRARVTTAACVTPSRPSPY